MTTRAPDCQRQFSHSSYIKLAIGLGVTYSKNISTENSKKLSDVQRDHTLFSNVSLKANFQYCKNLDVMGKNEQYVRILPSKK